MTTSVKVDRSRNSQETSQPLKLCSNWKARTGTPLPKNRRFCRIMSVGAVWQMPLTRTREIGRRRIRHRSEAHTTELQSRFEPVCRLLLVTKELTIHY